VQQNWKQVHDKQMHVNWNKMKKIGGWIKKTQVTRATPYEWLWYEQFGEMFGGITKINGVPPTQLAMKYVLQTLRFKL
jgi:hypothetical protein